MSDIDITEELDQDLDQDLYLDEDDLDNLESNKSIKFYPNKNKSDLDNDDNENDYLNDEEPDENEDPDIPDEDYDNYELNDDDDDDDLDDLATNSKITFITPMFTTFPMIEIWTMKSLIFDELERKSKKQK